ncbi:MAG: PBECR4 domain-containing protein [Bacilli bacterium]|nr:PBECR4 domain-containing protein [Bacilli bacterium]
MILINDLIALVNKAALSYSKLIGFDFILSSNLLKYQNQYIVRFRKENFLHLTGIETNIHPTLFYELALNGRLSSKVLGRHSKRYLRYVVKKKIMNLINIDSFFDNSIDIEEDFHKGVVYCLIATTNGNYTLGFIGKNECRPRTLLDDNQLNPSQTIKNISVKKVPTK